MADMASARAKAARCRLAGCPMAARAGDPLSPCAACTGPVTWPERLRDGSVRVQGRARSCHGCPMDGRGLPVCWAACCGPNRGFATDGQSVVTLGGLGNPEAYVADFGRSWLSARADGAGPTAWGFKGFSSEREELLAVRVAERILRLGGREFAALASLCRRRTRAANRRVAERIGCDVGLVERPDGVVRRILSRLCGCSAGDWDVLRLKALGLCQSEVARRAKVSKQAVSKRVRRIRERTGLAVGAK